MGSFDSSCWSAGHFQDPSVADDAILLDDLAQSGSQAVVTQIVGTAHAGNAGNQVDSDARMAHYDLLFFAMGRPAVVPQTFASDAPLFGYRVSGKAVGYDVSGVGFDDGTASNLLRAGNLTLPWGAYWLVLVTVPLCTGAAPYNNGLVPYVRAPASVADGIPYPFALSDPTILNGMTKNGLGSLGILNNHVVAFRVNRREWAT